MAVRIVRLGTRKQPGEGVRFGTVRRPPRGVPRSRYSADNWFDIWLPNLAPSASLVAFARKAKDRAAWRKLAGRYESEMARPENSRLLDALGALSHHTNFSVGCYCDDERWCHRGVLRKILKKHGAKLAG